MKWMISRRLWACESRNVLNVDFFCLDYPFYILGCVGSYTGNQSAEKPWTDPVVGQWRATPGKRSLLCNYSRSQIPDPRSQINRVALFLSASLSLTHPSTITPGTHGRVQNEKSPTHSVMLGSYPAWSHTHHYTFKCGAGVLLLSPCF